MASPNLVHISRKAVTRVLAACAILLILAALAGQIAIRTSDLNSVRLAAEEFNLERENNVPAWFSTVCLFLCALTLCAIGFARRSQRDAFQWYWFAMAAIFAGLSLDECASFHEALIGPVRNTLGVDGFLHFAWVVPGMAFALVFVLVFLKFLARLPGETRRAFIIAGAVYCSGALGMEMVGGKYASLHGMRDFPYALISIAEESLEMFGIILFLRALLAHVGDHVGDLTLTCKTKQLL